MKRPSLKSFAGFGRKKKSGEPETLRPSNDPLRFKSNTNGHIPKVAFGPSSSKTQSPGSAVDILGIMVNPNPIYMDLDNGRTAQVALFSSAQNDIALLSAEIDELRKQVLRLDPDQAADEEERESLKDSQNEIRGQIRERELKINVATRAIAYHDVAPPIGLDIVMRDYVDQATFVLRSFQRDLTPFTERLDEVSGWGNSVYADYIRDYKYHVTGTEDPSLDLRGRTLRDLIYWTAGHKIAPDPKMPTASLYGKVVERDEAAHVLRETIERYPYSIVDRKPLAFERYRGDPLNFACPNLPFFDDDYYVINRRGYQIYKWIIPLAAKDLVQIMRQVLSLDVDLLVCADMISTPNGREMWLSALLRTSSDLVNGEFYKLRRVERNLRRFNATPLVGQDLRHAFQAFVPGSEILHKSVRYKIHTKVYEKREASLLFGEMGSLINAGEATSQGNFFFGFRNGDRNSPVFRDAESECVTMAFVAQQGAGKTETATKRFVLPRTPNALVIHWSTAHGESWPQLARRLSGNVLTINLDDAGADAYPNREERLAAQVKINEAAAKKAKDTVAELRGHWEQVGLPVGLPLVIKPVKDTVAYMVFASTFLNEFSLAYETCFIPRNISESEKSAEPTDQLSINRESLVNVDEVIGLAVDDPRLCVIFLDDINNLDKEAGHPELGDIPMQVAQSAREVITKGLYNFRKRRQVLIVTVQSINHLVKFYPVDAFASIVSIELTGRTGAKVAKLYDPQGASKLSEMAVREDNIDVRLDPYLLNYSAPLHEKFSKA